MKKSRLVVPALVAALPAFCAAAQVELSIPEMGRAPLAPVTALPLATPALMALPEVADPIVSGFLPTLPAATIRIVPAALAVEGRPAANDENAISRARKALAALPQDIGRAGDGEARDAGARVEAAMTGERSAGGSGSVDASAPSALETRVANAKGVADRIKAEIAKVIVGQREMVESIVMAMAAGKHVLLEGVPGVAKTEASNAAASAVDGQFQRVQGTPDLLPSDILGSEVLEKDETGKFVRTLMKGPIFTNLLLVDEINRMPQKVQSALLQAMAEKKVTIGRQTFNLPHFTVLATQNPVEQAGTNPLPEAQLDRFMFKVLVDEGSLEETKRIMRMRRSDENQARAGKVASLEELDELRRAAESIAIDDGVEDYIARVARAPKLREDLAKSVDYSVGTRASLDLERAARLHAVMAGRTFVSVEDVRAVAARVLRHRMTLTYDAQQAGLSADKLIEKILETEPLPGGARLAAPGKRL